MEWRTIYVSGKFGFEEEVLDQLEHSKLTMMPGTKEGDLVLFWIPESTDLRQFKKAIGSKTVFKYRLQFYRDPAEFQEKQSVVANASGFSAQEQDLIRKMIESRKEKVDFKKIA